MNKALHWLIWIISGLIITVVSIITVYIRKVQRPALFKIMIYVGIGMLIFGLIKRRKRIKEIESKLEERRQKRRNEEAEFDMTRQQQNTKPKRQGMYARATQQNQNQNTHHHTQAHHYGKSMHQQQQNPQRQVQTPVKQQKPVAHNPGPHSSKKFCYNCGSHLHPTGRYCQSCGIRL